MRLPINGVAFHPRDPVIAITAGSHDGGWLFEGDLVLWNWVEGKTCRTCRPFKQIPGGRALRVLRCRRSPGGVEPPLGRGMGGGRRKRHPASAGDELMRLEIG